MNEKIAKALYRAAALTFEELGFMFPSSELDPLQKYSAVEAVGCVDFEGPYDGRLVVRMCGGVLPVLAANMMGELTPPGPRLQDDALGEIANIICGNLLPSLAGAKEVFQLKTPRVMSLNEQLPPSPGRLPAAEVQVGLEEGRADLILFLVPAAEKAS
jgi:CheY-specific phosphatase CheX